MMKCLLSCLFVFGALHGGAYTLEPSTALEVVSGTPGGASLNRDTPQPAAHGASAWPCQGASMSQADTRMRCAATAPEASALAIAEAAQGMTRHQSLLVVSLLMGIAVGFLAIRR